MWYYHVGRMLPKHILMDSFEYHMLYYYPKTNDNSLNNKFNSSKKLKI